MSVLPVIAAADSSGRVFAPHIAIIIAILFVLWNPTLAAAGTDPHVIPLTRANASVNDYYGIQMQLGSTGSPQSVLLLPVLYTFESHDLGFKKEESKPLYVPSANVCFEKGKKSEWSKFINPSAGEVINTVNIEDVYKVRWDANAFTKEVNLSLREGNGADGKNITIIEMGITNNGIYEWKAARMKRIKGIKENVELTLMLWTNDPPQRSYSPTFIMTEDIELQMKNPTLGRRNSPKGFKKSSACLDYLSDHGGVYNHMQDQLYEADNGSDDIPRTVKSENSDWWMRVAGTGSTSITYKTRQLKNEMKDTTVTNIGVNLMSAGSLSMGIVALSELQRLRSKEAESNGQQVENVVGIYLGSGDIPGNVVMGGYDKELIDKSRGAIVYEKKEDMKGGFEVQLVGVAYAPTEEGSKGPKNSFGKAPFDEVAIPVKKVALNLSFHSSTILLPEAIFQNLLPYLGELEFDKDLNKYFYSAPAKTDYSLRFTLATDNSGEFVNITIPATSLVARAESGRQYLLLSPLHSSDKARGYLGRPFVKHIYMVDDSHLGKFFVSAVNTTAAVENISELVTGSFGIMDTAVSSLKMQIYSRTSKDQKSTSSITLTRRNDNDESKSSLVGPLLGGVIGGIAVLWLIFLFVYLRRKRIQSQSNSENGDDKVEDGEKAIENGLKAIFGSGGKKGARDIHFHLEHEEINQFGRILKEVDVPVASLRGSKHSASPRIPQTHMAIESAISEISPRASPKQTVRASFKNQDLPPPVPEKDEQYLHTLALSNRRFSQPLPKKDETPMESTHIKRKSAPIMTLEAMGSEPYARYLRDNDTSEDLQSPIPIQTYHQALAQHQARRQRVSYIDSASSNGIENDTDTGNTSSTETATLGKVIAKGQVAKIRQLSSTPPHVAHANTLERRASVGRVVLPGEVIIVPPSRRTSRSSRELLRTPRKSNSPAASSSHSGESTREGSSVGHRRGKSAPSELGFPMSPGLPPPRAKDDVFVAGVRMVGGRAVGPSSTIRRVPVPNSPLAITEDASPEATCFFEDSPEDDVSSSSSTALPKNARLLKKNNLTQEKEIVRDSDTVVEELDFSRQRRMDSPLSPPKIPPRAQRHST